MINLSQKEDAIIDSVVQHVFKAKSKLPFDRKSTRMIAETLLKAIEEGYGSALSDLTPGTPDYNMMQALGRNIYVFSAAKDLQMCKDISKLLMEEIKDKEGKPIKRILSFNEFRQKSAETLKQWVGPWLKAEYSHALASAQMASNWVELENSPATKLRYLTVNDRRVRPSHAKLHNICLPKDDAFWNTWYPPNGWLCRCNVISDSSGKLTDKSKIEYPDTKEAPEAFRFNPGKKKVIFPPDHPYYKDIEKGNLLPALLEMLREYQFDKIGKDLYEHILVNKSDSDYRRVRRAGEIISKEIRVEILPPITDPALREIVLHGAREGKNPDFKIGNEYADLKSPIKSGYDVIRQKAKESLKQGNIAVIQLPEVMEETEIEMAAESKLKGEKRLKAIYIIQHDGSLKVYKNKADL